MLFHFLSRAAMMHCLVFLLLILPGVCYSQPTPVGDALQALEVVTLTDNLSESDKPLQAAQTVTEGVEQEESTASSDLFQTLKQIPLYPGRKDVNLSIGAVLRPRYEHLLNDNWGEDGIPSDGVYYQRVTLNADLRLTRYFRVFGEVVSAYADGLQPEVIPVARNDLDMGQLYAEPSLPLGRNAELTVRIGRQRLDFASGRLVNSREGTNMYRAFDAIHPELKLGRFHLSGLISRPVENRLYVFDDRTSRREWLNGAALEFQMPQALPGTASLYYLYYSNDQAFYVQGIGEEKRHSIGLRVAGKRQHIDYDWEGVCQLGRFGEADIRAWTIATDTGYTLHQVRWKPRLGVKFHYASGDSNPNDRKLGSFNALFPKGAIVGEYAIIGPRNFINPIVSLSFKPMKQLTVSTEGSFFWRAQTADGVYNAAGRLLRRPEGSKTRYVASEASVIVRYNPFARMELEAIYAVNFPGRFIAKTGIAKTVHLFQLTARYFI